MNNAATQEPWAPDECPADVVELISIEHQLHALGLRGLASANSKELRHGWQRLTTELRGSYRRGKREGLYLGLAVGAFAAITIGGTATMLLG